MMNQNGRKSRMTMIGTDPEFILATKGSFVVKNARSFPFFKGEKPTQQIGCDGAGYPVEIRPSPSSIKNVDRLCDNIEHILHRAASYCNKKNFTLVAGCGMRGWLDRYHGDKYLPIGCHIHFGSPSFNDNKKKNIKKLISVLDMYFTPITNMFMDQSDILERKSRGYGSLGSKEYKTYGFEYRTPYCFMVSPYFTKAFFSLAALLANNYKRITYDEELYHRIRQYYEGYSNRLNKIYPQIKKKILKLMKYNSPNQEQNVPIINLFNLIEQKKKYKNLDVLENYNLYHVEKFDPKKIYFKLSHGKFMEKLAQKLYEHKIPIIPKDEYIEKDNVVLLYGLAERRYSSPCMLASDDIKHNIEGNALMYHIGQGFYNTIKYIEILRGRIGIGLSYKNSIGLSYKLRKNLLTDSRMFKVIKDYLFQVKEVLSYV